MPTYIEKINTPVRIGILSSSLNPKLESALKYLVLTQNTVQKSIEFIFMPAPLTFELSSKGNEFLDYLVSKRPISSSKIEEGVDFFLNEYWDWVALTTEEYGLVPEERIPIIFISNVALYDNYYMKGEDDWGLIALGNWKQYMAPPTILEFFMILIVKCAVMYACKKKCSNLHLATKGCLLDFTASLKDARYKILTGFICNRCRKSLVEQLSEDFVKDIELLISKAWIGSHKENPSIASILKKFGYDLFVTKGFEPSVAERLTILLKEDGFKTILKIVGTIIITGLLFLFGLKGV